MLPARTFTHHESTVSSLHRKRKQASPWRAFETRKSISRVLPPSHSGSKRRRRGPSKHVFYVCCNRHVLPPSLSGSKHRWWRAFETRRCISKSWPHFIAHSGSKRRQWRASVTHRSPHSIAHSGSKRRQWRAYSSSRCRITSVDASCGTHTSRK